MTINFNDLKDVIKQSQMPFFRDFAPSQQTYPYIVYEFVNEQYKRISNKVHARMPLYQIAVVSDDVESIILPLQKAFDDAGVIYSEFITLPYDENDSRITQYITNVRCIND